VFKRGELPRQNERSGASEEDAGKEKKMETKKVRVALVTVVLTMFVLTQVFALPPAPKAKNAENSVAVEVPREMIAFFAEKGVDLSGISDLSDVDSATARKIQAIYAAEDSAGDRLHSGRINQMAGRAMTAAYTEAQAPVYLEFGPLYWGQWRDQDRLSESYR
jgi:hypothetical protein